MSRAESAWGSGKLILFGEHAVVYGHPAIAVALPRGLKVTLTPLGHEERSSAAGQVASTSPQILGLESLSALGETERAALSRALDKMMMWASARGVSLDEPHALQVEGALPFKVGLGSSAALSVALLRALAARSGQSSWSDAELFEGAMEMERVFHVTPSGLDHQVSISGGALSYLRAGDLPHFKTLTVGRPLTLGLTWVPREGSTADAVRGVAERRATSPDHYAELFDEVASVTRAGLIALERGAHSELGELFNRNHELLCALGVSTPELNRRCATLRSNGALGAKLSGAGHGGVCFGLFERREAAEEALSAFGSETWVVEVGVASR